MSLFDRVTELALLFLDNNAKYMSDIKAEAKRTDVDFKDLTRSVTAKAREIRKAREAEAKEAKKAETIAKKQEKLKAAAAHGARHMEDGGNMEVAQVVCEHLATKHGAPPAHDEGQLWVCHTDGIWRCIEDGRICSMIQGWRGVCTVGPDHRPFTLGNTDIAIKMAKNRCYDWEQGPGFFQGHSVGIVFKDCFFTLDDDGEILISTNGPGNRARFGFDFGLADGVFKGSKFEAYLESVTDDQTRIDLLAEHIGASMLGLAPRFGKALLLYGAGGGGKSTFLHLMQSMFPPGTVTSIQPHRWSHGPSLASMAGTRLNAVNEINTDDLSDLGTFKAMISGDLMEAEPKYRAPFAFRPAAGHVFTANPGQLPTVPDADEPFWQRLLCVPFDRVFRGTKDENKRMVEEILATEKKVMVRWALAGAQRLLAQGRYTICPAGDAVIAEWRGGVNPVAQFLSERTAPADPKVVASKLPTLKEVFEAYQKWCMEAGHKSSSRTQFGKRLRALGLLQVSNGNRVAVRMLRPYEYEPDESADSPV